MRFHRSFIAVAILLICLTGLAADSSLPLVSPMFGDNMVLQRGKPNRIWGWAHQGDAIEVQIASQSARATADAQGKWEVRLDPPPVGGTYDLSIRGPTTVVFHNVTVGDVWLCGGQSNMELPLARTRNGAEEISRADCPDIRLFMVKSRPSYSPNPTPEGRWKVCSPQTIAENGGFSAVGYFFARAVREQVHVPIGLVEDCLGGTPAEAWTSAETLARLDDFAAPLAELERLKSKPGPQYGNYIMHWYDDYDRGQKEHWERVDTADQTWKTVALPGAFAALGLPANPCVVWFRREFTAPDPLPKGEAFLRLGVVDRMDTAYVNGRWVGASAWVENPRSYNIPAGALRPGKNIVTVRVFQSKPRGGFKSKPEALSIKLGDDATIPLAGEWKAAVSVDARPPHPLPFSFENWPVIPSSLFQGMIEPVAPLALTGAIWYQGEANAERAVQYRKLLPAMIADWRAAFDQGDFPFYIVSLPAFMHHQDHPVDSAWAELRDAQAFAARGVPNSGLAVTIDTGDPDNIHPPDKKIVGQRLALLALARQYGKKVVDQGPTFQSSEALEGALKLNFDHADGGLTVKGDKLGEFAIAGADRQWHWADAKIEGDSVLVSSPEVPKPVAARYAWQSFPQATLFNGAGLPATPFRTDDWPLTTEGRK